MVRADLTRGVCAANVIHAAGESSPGGLSRGTYAVCLSAASEPELKAVEARLASVPIEFVSVVESDGPHAGQLMALGLRPCRKEVVQRHLSSLPLLR